MYSRARDASRAEMVKMVGRIHLLVAREQRCQLSDYVATFSEYSDPSIKLFFNNTSMATLRDVLTPWLAAEAG